MHICIYTYIHIYIHACMYNYMYNCICVYYRDSPGILFHYIRVYHSI